MFAMRATFDVNAGRPLLALERLETIGADSGRPLVMAALVQTLALPHVGRAADAVTWHGARTRRYAELTNPVELFQVNLLTSTESTALFELGQLVAATEVAQTRLPRLDRGARHGRTGVQRAGARTSVRRQGHGRQRVALVPRSHGAVRRHRSSRARTVGGRRCRAGRRHAWRSRRLHRTPSSDWTPEPHTRPRC